MALTVNRKPVKFGPDPKRVILKFFYPGGKIAKSVINRIIKLKDAEVTEVFNQALRDFSKRHRNITKLLEKHYDNVSHLFAELDIDEKLISKERKLLIGAYFSSEYSIESAAFFNPSIVEHPDQSELEEGQKRVIVSFRATGEGHISSIAFRMGIIDKDNNITFEKPGSLLDPPEFVKRYVYDKKVFINKLSEMNIYKDVIDVVMSKLGDKFIYGELQKALSETRNEIKLTYSKSNVLNAISWLANSHYEISFSLDTALSERVIFPVSYSESNGIEDARFVRFTEDDGSITYYATYTAYNGFAILPKLLKTKDFFDFQSIPINGKYAQDKNLALFPRKINGKYVMCSRIDGENLYIMFSDKVNYWDNCKKIQVSRAPWEFIKIGNCGSPIETEYGWLLITHGVGTMRKYCLGAVMLDKDDPTKVIGQLNEPLLMPNEEEREGYVPNVVYSCGSMIYNDELFIPYAMSDYASTIATVPLKEIYENIFPEELKTKNNIPGKDQMKILVVEDELAYRKMFYSRLSDENYFVELASDGVKALMSIAKNKFDLIISDINMPDFDGFQLLEYMNKKNINIPVIFITANKDDEYETKGLKLGASEFMRKPVNWEALLIKVAKIKKKLFNKNV